MESSIFKFVLRFSLRQQILVILLTAASMPFVYLALEVPKRIINQAIGGSGVPDELFGVPMDQVSYLFLLCGLFLLLVLINGGFKYWINVYRGVLGERMLRRLRYQLYHRLLRFPLPRFKQVSQGELIPMITAETEPLGGFIGDAFALPAFQGGLLVTYLFFIFNQDPLLGLVATSMYPLQAFIIPRLQKKVNQLARRRVLAARRLADRIGESIAGVTDIHANDSSHFERADIGHRLGEIYRIRFEIYRRKFFIKFFNNFLTQVTPFFFYAAGGYYVIMGELSLGALVAALAAYKDVASPWNELLKFYQIKEDVRVKYEQIVEQFDPQGLLDEQALDEQPESIEPLAGEVSLNNVVYSEDRSSNSLDGVSARFGLQEWMAVVGSANSGKYELGQMLAGLIHPVSGRIEIGELVLSKLPHAVLGRRIGYVDTNSFLFSGTVYDNLLYGLKHRPAESPPAERDAQEALSRERRDARLAGNSEFDVNADWIDYAGAGVEDARQLEQVCLARLDTVELRDDLFQFGLRSIVDASTHPDLVDLVLQARRRLRSRLEEDEYRNVVESFDPDRYNQNSSVAENLLFGATNDPELDIERLAAHPYLRDVLDRCALTDHLLETGRQVAQTMIELFADLPPGHEFFEQFSFINAEDLPEFQSLLDRIERQGMQALPTSEQTQLLSLAFRLIPARHRLGLVDDSLQARLVEARRSFAAGLPEELRSSVEFFDVERFNSAISIQDNILLGRLIHGQAFAESRLRKLLNETVDAVSLRDSIVRTGLDFDVGTGGSRLSMEQRQKVSLLRALLKRPDWLVINGGTSALDAASESRLVERLREHGEFGAVWVLDRIEPVRRFDRVMVLEHGRLIEHGAVEELLEKESGALKELMAPR